MPYYTLIARQNMEASLLPGKLAFSLLDLAMVQSREPSTIKIKQREGGDYIKVKG
jgi:hypothetical protein